MTLNFTVRKDYPSVILYLTDPDWFALVHPLVYRLEPLGKDRYRVYEKVKLGFFTLKFTYRAEIVHDAQNKTVTIRAEVFRLTRIQMVFALTALGQRTEIKETISFSSYLPVKGLLAALFRKQHEIWFHQIDSHLL